LSVATFALAAALASAAALSQPVLDAHAERQRALVERIAREESRGGPLSEELIAPLSELALAYQEADDRALASVTIERVRQVVRANYGLYSLAQAPLISQLIANEVSAGNHETAWELGDELLTLARRHPEDLRTVAIFREVTDQRFKNEVPWSLVCRGWELKAGCDNLEARGWPAWGRTLFLQGAMNNWGDAIDVLLHHKLYDNPELRELEEKLIQYGNCDATRESFRRLMFYDEATAATWLDRAATMVRAADTELVCAQTQRGLEDAALEHYRQAYELLERNGVARASIEALFSPDPPIVLNRALPAAAAPMATASRSAVDGYVDVSFEITKDGHSRKIDIVDATANTTDWEKRRVHNFIRDNLYRPRVANGKIADVSVVWRDNW
jgi:tetratricopeptide (TPR) repeat protein